jgi:hypothetical protein
MPLFGKTPGNFHFKKVDQGVFMSDSYVLLMDSIKNVYRYELNCSKVQPQKHSQDKRVALEIHQNSNFIELHPTDKDIWAVNSMRQLYVCRDFASALSKNDQTMNLLEFLPVNDIFNVMKAAIGNKHQTIIKIVKRLDHDLMIRPLEEMPELHMMVMN